MQIDCKAVLMKLFLVFICSELQFWDVVPARKASVLRVLSLRHGHRLKVLWGWGGTRKFDKGVIR